MDLFPLLLLLFAFRPVTAKTAPWDETIGNSLSDISATGKNNKVSCDYDDDSVYNSASCATVDSLCCEQYCFEITNSWCKELCKDDCEASSGAPCAFNALASLNNTCAIVRRESSRRTLRERIDGQLEAHYTTFDLRAAKYMNQQNLESSSPSPKNAAQEIDAAALGKSKGCDDHAYCEFCKPHFYCHHAITTLAAVVLGDDEFNYYAENLGAAPLAMILIASIEDLCDLMDFDDDWTATTAFQAEPAPQRVLSYGLVSMSAGGLLIVSALAVVISLTKGRKRFNETTSSIASIRQQEYEEEICEKDPLILGSQDIKKTKLVHPGMTYA